MMKKKNKKKKNGHPGSLRVLCHWESQFSVLLIILGSVFNNENHNRSIALEQLAAARQDGVDQSELRPC